MMRNVHSANNYDFVFSSNKNRQVTQPDYLDQYADLAQIKPVLLILQQFFSPSQLSQMLQAAYSRKIDIVIYAIHYANLLEEKWCEAVNTVLKNHHLNQHISAIEPCSTKLQKSLEGLKSGIIKVKLVSENIVTYAYGITIQYENYSYSLSAYLKNHNQKQLIAITRRQAFALFWQNSFDVVTKRAAYNLFIKQRIASALPYIRNNFRLIFGFIILTATAFLLFASPVAMALQLGLSFLFIFWVAYRFATIFIKPEEAPSAKPSHAQTLPKYTIAVPLYKEASSVPGLVASLNRLIYPKDRLQILFLLEAHDIETYQALQSCQLPDWAENIRLPDINPRTKPKALNVALQLATGDYFVIYDAEDRPEPDQLLKAANYFANAPENVGCLQAALSIDNAKDGFLTRHFAAEYEVLFNIFLPALAKLNLPIPLGGTSNHFKTKYLHQLSGWDAHNVTEDADLGMRLARNNIDCAILNSKTFEEAPNQWKNWLYQRTRWFKGWLQTWCVHMRHPIRLYKELGAFRFVSLQMVTLATIFAALIHPIFILLIVINCTGNLFINQPIIPFENNVITLSAIMGLGFGYICAYIAAFIACRRSGLMNMSFFLLTIPLYWLCLSIAAWRALLQFITNPIKWEKTTHGLALTSRQNEAGINIS